MFREGRGREIEELRLSNVIEIKFNELLKRNNNWRYEEKIIIKLLS